MSPFCSAETNRASSSASKNFLLFFLLATDILITPGYTWRWTDGLLTNFHLPRSTLMAMVASLLGDGGTQSGVQRLKSLYAAAIRDGYRFYSYGDAMLILP